MTPTKNHTKIAPSLILICILFGITLTYATGEGNYKNDTNTLPNIFEGTLTESGYKASIFVNPEVIGIYSNESGFKLDLTIDLNGAGDAQTENGYKLDLIPQKDFPEQHDLKVTNIKTSRTRIGKGYNVIINATISNQQLNYETFYFTINASTTIINTQTITLASRAVTTVTFKWNTTDATYGYYTISTQAHQVPGEAFTADNILVYGTIMITIRGDANGDQRVNSLDIGKLNAHWSPASGTPPWSLGYSLDVDTNDDGYINSLDIGVVNAHWGQSW